MIDIARILLLTVLLLTMIISSAKGVFSTNLLMSSISFSVGGIILNLGSILIGIGLPDEKVPDIEHFLSFLCRIGKDLFRVGGIILVFLGIVQFCRHWANKTDDTELNV